MKNQNFVLLTIFFILFPILSEGITREDVILTASRYVNIGEWTPKVDSTDALSPTWHGWYTTGPEGNDSLNISPPYNKLSYCWYGFDNPEEFRNRVENQWSPDPAGGQGTSKYGLIARDYIAGIDCAGFVLRCWGISDYSTWEQLKNYSIGIDESQLKRGDWINIPGYHQMLYESGVPDSPNVYESTSDYHVDTYNNNHYPGVQHNYNRRNIHVDSCYSIFPQFSVLNLVKELG